MQWERSVALVFAKEADATEGEDESEAQDDIRKAARDLSQGDNEREWCDRLLKVTTAVHERMSRSASPFELNTLRKLYTDASILRGLSQSLISQPADAIASLDQAIIIAGPYGLGRLDLILDIIRRIQEKGMVPSESRPIINLSKISQNPNISPLACTIPSLLTPPSFLKFQSAHSRYPFILRNYASDWPALCGRPWRSHAYLSSVAGPGRVVPVEVGNDYRSDDWKQKLMPWDDFLSLLEFEDRKPSSTVSNVYYMAQHNLTNQFPDLLDDIVIPDYLYAELDSPECPDYHPPLNDSRMVLNTWLGPKGTLSPAHVDPYFNFYIQVVGYKSVWLAPPDASRSMYSFPPFSEDVLHLPSSSLGNTSRVDVFANSEDLSQFPHFVDEVLPLSMTATMGPGDALFFPPGWWHAMRSESTSISLSMWF